MSIEQKLLPILVAAFGTTPVRVLHAEQLDDIMPASVPLVVLSRVGSSWSDWDTFCTGNILLADVTLEVNYLEVTLEKARKLADIGRTTIVGQEANLLSEFDIWEPELRVYRVTALFNMTDYQPFIN